MNIAIIEDLKEDMKVLSDIVTKFYAEQNTHVTIHQFSSGEEFLKTYFSGNYQLIFLDIYMETLTGMDVAEKIRAASDSCALIFISSSDSHAVSSYDVQAAYYLLKPVDRSKLCRILSSLKLKDAQDQNTGRRISYG